MSWNAGTLDAIQVLLRAAAALFMIAAGFVFTLRYTRWLLPQGGVPLRWSSLSAVGMWISTVGCHGLLALHAFQLGWALLCCALLAGLAARAWPGQRSLGRELRREVRAARALWRWGLRGPRTGWGALGICIGLLTLRALVIPPLAWDTVTYHGPRAAQWVLSNKFTFDRGVVAYDYYRHFFSGGEVLTAWAMLPFHSDLACNLASVVQWLSVGLGAWALARALGIRGPFAVTSAVTVMFIPTLLLEVNSGYVELPLNAALIHGAAIAVTCLRRPSVRAALLCAMSLGVAAGIKLPGAPPAGVFAAVVLLRVLTAARLPTRSKLLGSGAALLVACLPSWPWLWRAYRDTGYPLSPMPVSVWGHTWGVASATMGWYSSRPQLQPYTWHAEYPALREIFSRLDHFPNEALGELGLIPLALFPVGWGLLLYRRPLAAVALLLAVTAPVLVYFSAGMTPVRLTHGVSCSRFVLPTLALAIPVSLVWCRRELFSAQIYRWLLLAYPVTAAFSCVRRGWADWENREVAWVALALGIGILGCLVCARRSGRLALACAVLSWLLGCVLLQYRRDLTRADAYRRSFAMHEFPRTWAAGVAAVDTPERPQRIAITGGPDQGADDWFQYFYLGRRLQNELSYVTPTRDGSIIQLVPGNDLKQHADRASWLQRLHAQHIDAVLSFPPKSLEQRWMDADEAQFERLAGDRDWGLYRLAR